MNITIPAGEYNKTTRILCKFIIRTSIVIK